MKKRMLSYALIVVLTLLCACAPAAPPSSTTPPYTPPEPPVMLEDNPLASGDNAATTEKTSLVRWLIPVLMEDVEYTAACSRVEKLLTRVNAKLLPYELTLQIELRNVTQTQVYFPPDGRDEKCQSYSVLNDLIGLLTSKENYDLISVPTGHVAVTTLIDTGLLRNIASELPAYPNLMNALDGRQLDVSRYAGGIWGVPAGFDWDANLLAPYLAYRKSSAEALGIFDADAFGSNGDLLYIAGRAGHSGRESTVYVDNDFDAYHRDYAEYPFKVSPDFVFLYTQDGGVEPYVGSSVMWQDMELAKRLWVAGDASKPEGFVSSVMTRQHRVEERTFDFIQILSAVPEEETGDYAPIKLGAEKPDILYDNPFGSIINVVPTQASSYALAFFDALYGDRAIYEEFMDEGELFGSESTSPLVYERAPATSIYASLPYTNHDPKERYMCGRPIDIYHYSLFDCVRQAKLDPDTVTTRYGHLVENTTYTPMPWDGFVFDPTPVLTDYTRVAERTWGYYKEKSDARIRKEILDEHKPAAIVLYKPPMVGMHEIFYGPIDEDVLGSMSSEVEIAGLSVVLEECRRQYAAYLEKTGRKQP